MSTKTYTTYVEVGSWKGGSIIYLANCLKHRWGQVKIFAVDCFDNITNEIDPIFYKTGNYWEEYERNLINAGVRNQITDIKKLSCDAANEFKDRSVGFVFLDAHKSYECVMEDLEVWYPKIAGHGTLAGHDAYKPSVIEALKYFCNEKGCEFKTSSEDVWYII